MRLVQIFGVASDVAQEHLFDIEAGDDLTEYEESRLAESEFTGNTVSKGHFSAIIKLVSKVPLMSAKVLRRAMQNTVARSDTYYSVGLSTEYASWKKIPAVHRIELIGTLVDPPPAYCSPPESGEPRVARHVRRILIMT